MDSEVIYMLLPINELRTRSQVEFKLKSFTSRESCSVAQCSMRAGRTDICFPVDIGKAF